jgi:hypothetical protein
MPAIPTHVFSAEEALAAARIQGTTSKVRRYFVPPAYLTEDQAELFQGLRLDGVEPVRAAELATLM